MGQVKNDIFPCEVAYRCVRFGVSGVTGKLVLGTKQKPTQAELRWVEGNIGICNSICGECPGECGFLMVPGIRRRGVEG